MRKKLKGIAIASITVFSGIAMVAASLAWFLEMTTYSLEQANINANSGGAYFAYGDGSNTKPYGIATTRHLYNLAWMQYLGLFEDRQYYFELANDVNMTGYYLPPIGTSTYPFLGQFNGNGHSVTGLTVTNSYSDFTGYSQSPETVNSSNFVAPEIVGFFGVVGKLPDTTTTYTYNSAVNTFTNTTLDSITIKGDGTAKLLTGLAAGYASATLQDIEVGGTSTINVNGQASTEFSDKLTDFGLVGFTTNKGSRGSYTQELSEYYDGETGGQGDDWGGSVAMQDMYTRLRTIAGRSGTTTNNKYPYERDFVTKPDGTTMTRDALTGYAYTYRSQKEGSFVFGRYENGPVSDFMYMGGGTRYHRIKQTATQTNNGFTIRSGTGGSARYLGIQNGAIANVQTGWYMDNNNRLSAYINGTLYYLNHNCQIVTQTTDTWKKGSNNIYYIEEGYWWDTNYYLTYRNNTWQAYDPGWGSTPTLTLASATITRITETSNGSDYMDYSGTNVTYFPLITEEGNYNAAQKNTGYVMGGTEDHPPAYPDKTGDIRVSRYAKSNISGSYSNGKLNTVYTINSNLQTVKINKNDYLKYNDSEAGLLDMLSGSYIYGLHFMSANINVNNLVTADYALINGVEKSNYKMPASSIDFKLAERGVINFFAGTYYDGNDSFFSLHNIVRDENDNITGIKEISSIYGSSDKRKPYIYKYSDNTTSAALTSDYSLVFSTNRIKKQSSVTKKAVYYFEIPVNAGEFALGSVSDGTGAYLMYLDIGTNGVPPDPVHAYWITSKSTDNPYPLGVDFCPVEITGQGGETFGIYIPANSTGALVLAVGDASVSITDSAALSTYSYKGTKFSDNNPPAGNFIVSGNSPGQMKLPPIGGTRVLMVDLTNALDANQHFTIRITDYLTNADGNFDPNESTYEIDDGTGYISSTEEDIIALSAQMKLNTFRSLAKVATLTRSSGVGEFKATYDAENCDYKNKIVDVDIELDGTTIQLDVTDGYTFKIGGTQYNSGSIYPST